MNNIFQADYNLKDQNDSLLEYFSYLEEIQNNEKFSQNIDNYSFSNNEDCIENDFISRYYKCYQRFKSGQEHLDLNEYENFLEKPETNAEFEM